MRIRQAVDDDLLGAMNVLDGANLAISKETVDRRIETGDVLVASESVVSGVLVSDSKPDGVHVDALAVRGGRRDQGIGRRLLHAASARWGIVSASFDPVLKDFYRSVGFEIRSVGERCYGELPELDG